MLCVYIIDLIGLFVCYFRNRGIGHKNIFKWPNLVTLVPGNKGPSRQQEGNVTI
jgi:hypothetical protein